MVARNPFKPSAGATPPLLVGRTEAIEEFKDSLADGPGAPGRLTIFTGARGVGKTVMLTEVANEALKEGWVAVSETATPGLVERLTHAVTRHLHDLDPSTAPGRSLTGVTLPVIGGGVTVSSRPAEVVQWREQVGRLLDVLEADDTGLLITVDEVHRHARDELRDLAATFQPYVRTAMSPSPSPACRLRSRTSSTTTS